MNLELASQGAQPVGHPLKAGAVRGLRRVEPPSVIDDLEPELSGHLAQTNHGLRSLGVLRHVLKGFQDAEVDGRFD